METISRDELDCAWLAGIFDGEGCVSFPGNRARVQPQVRWAVKNTSPFMLRRISEILCKWQVTFHYQYDAPGKEEHKERMSIVIGGSRGVRKVLERTLPYLTAKYEEAMCVVDYLRWRLEQVPLHGCGEEFKKSVAENQQAVIDELHRLKARRFSFQRLPRRASAVLSLDKLEAMV